MAVTIHEVAKAAGVGVGTVSRVINNSQAVKKSTREKVLQVIAQLNYYPDPIARSMIKRRTGSLGVIIPFFTRHFSIEVLRGVETEATRQGYELVIYNVENVQQRRRYFTELPMRRRVDGLLIVSLSPDETEVFNMKEAELSAVLIDAYSPLLTSIVVNNVDGAYNAMRYLIARGHRRIGFLNGIIEGSFKFNQANDRLIGVHRALGEAGITFEPELVAASHWNKTDGKEAAYQLLTLAELPTAIFVASDIQAVGVFNAAQELGIKIPEQLSLISFDGIEISEVLELTTIQQPMHEMGALGTQRLLALLEDDNPRNELIRLNTELVERRTVQAIPVANSFYNFYKI